MKKIVFYAIATSIMLGMSLYLINTYIYTEKQGEAGFEPSYKEVTYTIEGEVVSLVNNETSLAGISYFGNEAEGDINGDGISDIVFLVTKNGGGSGTFYYVVAGIKTDTGYLGTNGVFLGDRIAPQTTEIREGQIIVNFAERKEGEPMTARPSMGVSKYIALEGGSLVVVK